MRDTLGSVRDAYDSGRRFGLATVVGVSKSAPRQPRAPMAVVADGEVVGSVSGACVVTVCLTHTHVDSRTVICVLTHDPTFDVPLLEVALRTPAGYVGAMGSGLAHDKRLAQVREAGLTEADIHSNSPA